jgi:hypothetical protein
MKRSYLAPVILVMAALAWGCASDGPSPSQSLAQSIAENSGLDLPDFVLNPPQQKDTIFGIGSAKMSIGSDSQTIDLATARARQSLAFQLNTNVQSMITDYVRESGAQDETSGTALMEILGRQLTDTKLVGATPVKTVKTNDGTFWVQVSYNKAEAAKAAADIIKQEAARYAELKSMDALKLMEEQLSKTSTIPVPVTQ